LRYSIIDASIPQRRVLEIQIADAKMATEKHIKTMLDLERPPVTYTDGYFKTCRERFLLAYINMRKETKEQQVVEYEEAVPIAPYYSTPQPRIVRAVEDYENKDSLQYALKTLARHGFPTTKDDLLSKLGREDEHKEELEVMAEVQAYFRVSYKACCPPVQRTWLTLAQRMIDMIPRIIDHIFLRQISKDLFGALLAGLELDDDNAGARAQAYLEENEGLTKLRETLERKRKKLEKVNEKLANWNIT
jgi:hypothetical protein